ncbi:S-adenosyl-L-methionine-dependent methyltransferase [Coprinopsis marcescibilis]|uniref:phosphoethanolamine N-methyltransferase n=1 Tax=Coprinopsis marcescibilis TaxID=230819 RepID=A0A5C3LCC1_COPMA|nr:S-adenosyl-L-methionine-dependent methyltransferase [Coprinopsis marcescibilis]
MLLELSAPQTLLVGAVALVVALWLVYSPSSTTDTVSEHYGLFHLALNRLPDGPSPPVTEWLNMGFWREETLFPRACRALAQNLVVAAAIKPNANILDVGFGTGESILFLLSDPDVPQPKKITGITNVSAQCERAKRRVANAWPQFAEGAEQRVFLYTADAICDGSQDHPLSSPDTDSSFDAVLALDCAYHFNTRWRFLHQSFSKLTPGGRIALADICFAPQGLSSLKTRLVTSTLRMMPMHNRTTVLEYRTRMQDAGFEDIVIENITSDVFPRFIQFLKRQGWNWWIFGTILQIYVSTGCQYVVVSGRKPCSSN